MAARKQLAAITVPGRPVGYYAQGAKPNWRRKNAYEAYKKHVQRCIADAGIDRASLAATKDRPVLIHTKAFFETGVHPDPENVRKGIADAIYYGIRGGDKHTGGPFDPPLYDRDNPRVEVVIGEARST